jgi:hypothetical protein
MMESLPRDAEPCACVRFVPSRRIERPAAAQLNINGKSGSRWSLTRRIPNLIEDLETHISTLMDQSLEFSVDCRSSSRSCVENVAWCRNIGAPM